MKKKLTCFIFAAALVLSMPTALFAAETGTTPTTPIGQAIIDGGDGGIAVTSVDSSNISASRISSTSANVSAYAAFNTTATKATCTIILQEKSGSSWITPSGLSVTSYVKTVYNANSITAGKTFAVKSGKVYRAKILFSDTNSSGTYYRTRYTGSF